MTPKHISFGDIERFEQFFKTFKSHIQFVGKDDNGNALYDENIKLPTLSLDLSEKIHGTNAAFCYGDNTAWCQSRENILTPIQDNAGCAFSVEANKNVWISLVDDLAYEYDIDLSKYIVSIFYEWCGGSIQKNSCVSGLDKMAIIFQYFKVSPIDNESPAIWLETKFRMHKKPDCEYTWIDAKNNNIYNVMNLPHYNIQFDFNTPSISIQELVQLVEKIETNSPIGKTFGIENNIAEGVVATFEYNGTIYRFKVKGDKHSSTKKAKVERIVDDEIMNKKIECAEKITPNWRLEQSLEKVFGINNEKKVPTIKDTGDVIKWVLNDIVKEELHVIAAFGFELKDVSGIVSKIVSNWFKEELYKNL